MSKVSIKKLLETGVHFGHRTGRWHPKMKPYIFTERNGIHVIDLQQTIELIEESYNLIRDKVASGGEVLFVGTKKQAQDAVQQEAERCDMPYVNRRWLGGMITNWRTMKERINELERLESEEASGEWDSLKKKEKLMLNRKIDKLLYRLGGIRSMKGLPSLLFVVDIGREIAAIREAKILGIPVIAMVDTNCDPSSVEYVLPANDDAIRAIRLVISYMADAVIEGISLRAEDLEDAGHEMGSSDQTDNLSESDEDLLGASTLAKLSSGELEFADSDNDTDSVQGVPANENSNNSEEEIDDGDGTSSDDHDDAGAVDEEESKVEDEVTEVDKVQSSKSELEG